MSDKETDEVGKQATMDGIADDGTEVDSAVGTLLSTVVTDAAARVASAGSVAAAGNNSNSDNNNGQEIIKESDQLAQTDMIHLMEMVLR